MICLLEGLDRGSVFALCGSLFYLFSGSAAGVYSIVFITALAIFATWLRQSWLQKGMGAALICTAGAMLAYEIMVCAIGAFLGLTSLARIGSFCFCAVLTMVVAPLIYPVIKAIGGPDIWKE
jgi:hypothetical protein